MIDAAELRAVAGEAAEFVDGPIEAVHPPRDRFALEEERGDPHLVDHIA